MGRQSNTEWATGQSVRYKPGTGIWGYEDVVEADGCLSGVVVGFTTTRVRIRFTKPGRLCNAMRAVDAKSLRAEAQ